MRRQASVTAGAFPHGVLALAAAAAAAAALLATGCTYGGYDEPAHASEGVVPVGGAGAPGPGPSVGPMPGPPPSGASISGTIVLSDALASKGLPTDTIYVIVRPAPVGPPLAVKKIASPVYPVSFVVSEADVMGGGGAAGAGMGGGLAGNLWVIVRVDRDGNAGPPAPGDLEGAFPRNPVTAGARDVNIVVDREIGAGPAGPAGPAPAAPGTAAEDAHAMPPPAPAATAPLPAAGPPGPLSGTVEIAPAHASKVAPSDTLFIIVRDAPVGPPLAVKKIAGPAFPLSFTVGPADAMAGPGAWPAGPFWISARLDKDGNAMSKAPGDVAGKIDGPVPSGATGLRVVLAEAL